MTLVLHLLLPRQEDGFVSRPEVKTAFTIEALRPLIRFVYEQADRLRILEQTSHQFRHKAYAEILVTRVVAHPHAFEVTNFRGLQDHAGFENQLAVLDDHPGPSLFDTSQAPLAKTERVDLHRVDTTFVAGKLCLNRHDELQLAYRCRPGSGDWLAGLDGPRQLKQPFTTSQSLATSGV